PGRADAGGARPRLGLDLVDTLVEIPRADVSEPDLAAFVRPGSYSERQVRRFMQLWPLNATRDLPVPEVGERLGATIPEPLPLAGVPRDYPPRHATGAPPRRAELAGPRRGAGARR